MYTKRIKVHELHDYVCYYEITSFQSHRPLYIGNLVEFYYQGRTKVCEVLEKGNNSLLVREVRR